MHVIYKSKYNYPAAHLIYTSITPPPPPPPPPHCLCVCLNQVKNPFGKVMLSRHYSAEGRFTFTSHDSGEHVICIGTNTTRWFGGNRLVCIAIYMSGIIAGAYLYPFEA